jgi:transcriptional regulator with XRE-family HTH domain
MGKLIRFPRRVHARASKICGHKSGRSSDRDTPVASSIGKTNSAGTPFFDRESQYQTCDCDVPMRSARGFWPPAIEQALLSASVDMHSSYRHFGGNQPINLSQTGNQNFGRTGTMQKGQRATSRTLAQRVLDRREAVGLSQSQLAKACGMSQQGIDSIEQGSVARPRKLLEIANALQTSQEWLLFGEGKETIRPVNALAEIASRLEVIDQDKIGAVLQYVRTLQEAEASSATPTSEPRRKRA